MGNFGRLKLTFVFYFLGGNFDKLRRGADIAVLMTKDGDESGVSIFDRISTGQTLAVVMKDTAVGYYR